MNYVPTISSDMADFAALLSSIDPYLYLSDIVSASTERLIEMHQIKHIVTVLDRPLWKSLVKSVCFIQAEDLDTQDLISEFSRSYNFIDRAVRAKEAVLVHCVAGVSRSATIVMAYLMRKYKINHENAFKKVCEKRPVVNPNDGFIDQLKLFAKMNFNVDVTNKEYRLIVMTHLCVNVKRKYMDNLYNLLPDVNEDMKKYFAKLETKVRPRVVFKCRRCRVLLFNNFNILLDEWEECHFIFTEPPSWIVPDLQESLRGDIKCPKCDSKIGIFDLAGLACEENCKIHADSLKLGSFKMTKSKIDIEPQAIKST